MSSGYSSRVDVHPISTPLLPDQPLLSSPPPPSMRPGIPQDMDRKRMVRILLECSPDVSLFDVPDKFDNRIKYRTYKSR